MTTERTWSADNQRDSATSGSYTKQPLRIAHLAADAQGPTLVVMASIAAVFALDWVQGFHLDRFPLDRSGQRGGLGRGSGLLASRPLSGAWPRRHRHRRGGRIAA